MYNYSEIIWYRMSHRCDELCKTVMFCIIDYNCLLTLLLGVSVNHCYAVDFKDHRVGWGPPV